MTVVRVAGAQLNLSVGDLDYNESRVVEAMARAEDEGADVLVLPELAISGYPPEDLVLRPAFVDANLATLNRLAARAQRVATVVGLVARGADGGVSNAAALVHEGRVMGFYHKVCLPNYGVFDEKRYFVPGNDPAAVWNVGGVQTGISICEDIWVDDGPPAAQARAGAGLLLNINGSPFGLGKGSDRLHHVRRTAVESRVPVVYLNQVGGQDELVFDGGSLVVGGNGAVLYQAPHCEEDFFVVDIETGPTDGPVDECASGLPDSLDRIYRVLVLGLRDYVRKNGFRKVVVGLSGGIDSALTAVIAVDALGRDAVRGVMMPSDFSSAGSVSDSKELANRLGIRLDLIPIAGLYGRFRRDLEGVIDCEGFGVAEENLQPRIRGTLLMAISNRHGELVVATGNKSEMAVGYATLYGDMAGAYAVLKDVYKTMVYDLACRRNRDGEVIPESIISKPPSAELRPDQLDTDTLPPYDVLDPVLRAYIEEDRSVDDIVAAGFGRSLVMRIAALVDRNEHKRRQAPPGAKITTKAFGRDRRIPITNGWRRG